MAGFCSLNLLICQASRKSIKTDPLATWGHDFKREAQQGTQRLMPKGRESEGQTLRAFPNRSSYSKIYRRKEREREPLRNTIQKSRGHFSADWVFLSPPRAVSGAQHPVLYPSAVAARKGAGTSTKHQHAAHSQLSQGSKLQVTSLSTGRTSPSRQNGEELLYFSCYETSGCQSCLEKGCVSAS